MKDEEVLDLFRKGGALLDGHFLYASGRHGCHFLQAARVLQFPKLAEQLCRGLAEEFKDERIELVVGPATGGIILAYETGRQLGCRTVYSEKDGQGGMAVKRGFAIRPGLRALVVEDVITTGGSVQKTIDHLLSRGVDVAGVAVLIDRSGGEAKFECRYEPLARFTLESWPPDQCPLCREGKPLIDPDDLMGPESV